jgi:hypothetical protein
MTIIQLLRRHEETAKNPKTGKKLDQPTPKGIANAYQKGMKLIQLFPDAHYQGIYSNKDRTYITVAQHLLGAGITNIDEYMTFDPLLNSAGTMVPKAVLEAVRNIEDPYELNQKIFELSGPEINQAGANHLKSAIQGILKHIELGANNLKTNIDIRGTHGPSIDVSYILLARDHEDTTPVTFEDQLKYTEMLQPGTGLNLFAKKVGGEYKVRFGGVKTPKAIVQNADFKEFPLAQLVEKYVQ